MKLLKKINIPLKNNKYPIFIGKNILNLEYQMLN